jgi:aminoglycoside phosphotransferase (APT) family kinase protein
VSGTHAIPTDGSRPAKLAEGREAEIFAWGEGRVLRLYRSPRDEAALARELAALETVRAVMPCVPAVYGRAQHEGRPGLVLERLDGHDLFAEMQRRPWRVFELALLTGRLHAELNALAAPPALPELRGELRRRIERLADVPDELRAAALAELARLPDGTALCHGDFHPQNVLLCPHGPAVIDWPHATRGDPCADFARTFLMLRVGAVPPGAPALIRWGQWLGRSLFVRLYARGYQRHRRFDPETVRRWQFVRAVDRLADPIPEERGTLLREAERLRSLRVRSAPARRG